jgi:hypothetical protein
MATRMAVIPALRGARIGLARLLRSNVIKLAGEFSCLTVDSTSRAEANLQASHEEQNHYDHSGHS